MELCEAENIERLKHRGYCDMYGDCLMRKCKVCERNFIYLVDSMLCALLVVSRA